MCTVPVSSVALSVSTQGSLVAGSELNVTCAIAGQTSGLTGSYMTSVSALSIPGSITTTSLEDRGVSVININPLRTSYPTMFTCLGSYFSPAANRTLGYEDSLTIKVQSKFKLGDVISWVVQVLYFYTLSQVLIDICCRNIKIINMHISQAVHTSKLVG